MSFGRLTRLGNGYALYLSKRNVEDWATRPGSVWPCSTLRGHRLYVGVDSNGLVDLTIDGKDATEWIDGHELDAIVGDAIRGTNCAEFWPLWGPADRL